MKFCIHEPTFDAKSPSQMSRKSRYESAARAEPGRNGCASAGSRRRGHGDRRETLPTACLTVGLQRLVSGVITAVASRHTGMVGGVVTGCYLRPMTTELAPSDAPMAALTARAAERYPDGIAATYRRDGAWQQVTYSGSVGRGPTARPCTDRDGCRTWATGSPSSATRAFEFSIADLAVSSAGAIVVPVYPSNSPDECRWVVGDSGSKVDHLRERRPDRQDRTGPRRAPRPRARHRHRW